MGEYYKQKVKNIKKKILIISSVIFLYLFLILTPLSPVKGLDLALLILLFAPITILEYLILRLSFKLENFERGNKGEKAVCKILHELEEDAGIIFYSNVTLPSSTADIDFIVISKTGIFCIEVKNYSGDITAYYNKWYQLINGKKNKIKSPTDQAVNNALRFKEYIKLNLHNDYIDNTVFIKPLVVLVNNYKKDDIHSVVEVTDISGLKDSITNARFIITGDIQYLLRKLLDKTPHT
jgi:Holliday junction resolvase-like predicted endonuclease